MVKFICYFPAMGECYATSIYPYLMLLLSSIASVFPFSFDELIVVAVVLLLTIYPVVARRRLRRWKEVLTTEVEIVGWTYFWFYIGWGCNYYRDDFYSRMQIPVAETDSARFAGYFGLLPYIMRNARNLLSSDSYDEWLSNVNPAIIKMAHKQSDFWRSQRIAVLDEMQETIYNIYLKGNNIPSGTKNYDQVVQMIMSFEK